MFKRMRLLKSFINPRELDEEYKTEHQKMLAIKGQMPYNKYSSIKKKFDSKAFFKNFNKIVNRG